MCVVQIQSSFEIISVVTPADGPSRKALSAGSTTIGVRWKLFADLAEVAGQETLQVAGEPDTVGEALRALLNAHPDLAERVQTADGELAADVNLLHNGSPPSDGLDTPVGASDELALFPPVSGG